MVNFAHTIIFTDEQAKALEIVYDIFDELGKKFTTAKVATLLNYYTGEIIEVDEIRRTKTIIDFLEDAVFSTIKEE